MGVLWGEGPEIQHLGECVIGLTAAVVIYVPVGRSLWEI